MRRPSLKIQDRASEASSLPDAYSGLSPAPIRASETRAATRPAKRRSSFFSADRAWKDLLHSFLEEESLGDIGQRSVPQRQALQPADAAVDDLRSSRDLNAHKSLPLPPLPAAAAAVQDDVSGTRPARRRLSDLSPSILQAMELSERDLSQVLPLPSLQQKTAPAAISESGTVTSDFEAIADEVTDVAPADSVESITDSRNAAAPTPLLPTPLSPLPSQPSSEPMLSHHLAVELERAIQWMRQGLPTLVDRRMRTLLQHYPEDLTLVDCTIAIFEQHDDHQRCIEWLFYRAQRLCKLGNFDDTAHSVERILSLDPRHDGAHAVRQLLTQRAAQTS